MCGGGSVAADAGHRGSAEISGSTAAQERRRGPPARRRTRGTGTVSRRRHSGDVLPSPSASSLRSSRGRERRSSWLWSPSSHTRTNRLSAGLNFICRDNAPTIFSGKYKKTLARTPRSVGGDEVLARLNDMKITSNKRTVLGVSSRGYESHGPRMSWWR
jgi:hypothetical protein